MIGNDYEKDICGAKKAGMKTVLFNENPIQSEFPDADYIIENFQEILNADILI
jgi:FMN phosphatase YigB (HAD superfamily)